MPGFPIRTSSDPRSVDNSPRHIAASHVLHRLPVPRHPPCALKHLQHKNQKMSHPHTPKGACGHQKNCTSDTKKPTPPHGRHEHIRCLDARNHYPQIKHHTPPPKMERQPSLPTRRPRRTGLLSQSPIVCLAVPSPVFDHSKPVPAHRLSCTRTTPTTGAAHPSNRPDHRTPTRCGRA